MNSESSLTEWINKIGAKQVAEKLDAEITSVCQWRDLHCLPRPDVMLRIQTLSRGRVSCNGMVKAFVTSKKKSTRKTKGN